MESPGQTYHNKNATDGVMIDIIGLSKSFEGDQVLKKIDLQVKKGENIIVLGKSGSGKSTLIRCLVGLSVADEGEIHVLGQNISNLNDDEMNALRLRIGFLFQGGALYDFMTVKENLLFPLRHHRKELSDEDAENLVMEALDQVGLKEAAQKMPVELSGGMSKRIALARSLILGPEIMLYDEPTTGLDSATAKEISQLMVDLQKKNGTSSIIITHDMGCARMTADRVVVLKDGSIVADGSYDAIKDSDDEWISSFFTY